MVIIFLFFVIAGPTGPAAGRPEDRLDPAISCRRDVVVAYYVYIMTNRRNGTPYVGVTNDLVRRVHQHRNGQTRGFTHRYNLLRLAYFEIHDTAMAAIQREKNIKHWPRAWKVALIEDTNPAWRDLFDAITR